jgi:plasmid stabilization system protein ParE
MKYKLIIRPEAEQDMQETFRWYEDRVLGLGREFLRCIDAALAHINRSPFIYPIIYKNIHRTLPRRFPFGIFYIISHENIIVLAVLHARRAPRSWQKRIRK